MSITQQQAFYAILGAYYGKLTKTDIDTLFDQIVAIEQGAGAQPGADVVPEPLLSVARIAHIGEGESPVISLVWHVATKDLETYGVVVDALLCIRPEPVPQPCAQPQQEQSNG